MSFLQIVGVYAFNYLVQTISLLLQMAYVRLLPLLAVFFSFSEQLNKLVKLVAGMLDLAQAVLFRPTDI
jgi:hypothetical protein